MERTPHVWSGDRCRYCGMHKDWPGASDPCTAYCIRGDVHRKKYAARKKRKAEAVSVE